MKTNYGERDYKVCRSLYKASLVFFFKQNQMFMNFSKNLKYEISVLWDYSILCRQTDMTKLTITVHKCSANASKNLLVTKYIIALHTEPNTKVITAMNLSAWLLQPEEEDLTKKV